MIVIMDVAGFGMGLIGTVAIRCFGKGFGRGTSALGRVTLFGSVTSFGSGRMGRNIRPTDLLMMFGDNSAFSNELSGSTSTGEAVTRPLRSSVSSSLARPNRRVIYPRLGLSSPSE